MPFVREPSTQRVSETVKQLAHYSVPAAMGNCFGALQNATKKVEKGAAVVETAAGNAASFLNNVSMDEMPATSSCPAPQQAAHNMGNTQSHGTPPTGANTTTSNQSPPPPQGFHGAGLPSGQPPTNLEDAGQMGGAVNPNAHVPHAAHPVYHAASPPTPPAYSGYTTTAATMTGNLGANAAHAGVSGNGFGGTPHPATPVLGHDQQSAPCSSIGSASGAGQASRPSVRKKLINKVITKTVEHAAGEVPGEVAANFAIHAASVVVPGLVGAGAEIASGCGENLIVQGVECIVDNM